MNFRELRNLAIVPIFTTIFWGGSPFAYRTVTENGAVLYVSERPSLPLVSISILIRAGSAYEPKEKAGLSYLTSQLLLQGTQNRSASRINEELEFVGADLAVIGSTDYVSINLTLLKKDLPLGLEILSDIILSPAFNPPEIRKKTNEIISRIMKDEESPRYLATKSFFSLLFGEDHPYGRLPEGNKDSLKVISRKGILDFWRTYYIPNNSIISMSGDVTLKEFLPLYRRYFQGWQRRDISIKPLFPERSKKEKGGTFRLINRDLDQATVIMGRIGLSRTDKEFYLAQVMNYIFGGGGFASRLFDRLREKAGLVYSVQSYFSERLYPGSYEITFESRNNQVQSGIEFIIQEMELLKKKGFDEGELRDAKSYLTGSFPLRFDTNQKVSRFLTLMEFFSLGDDYLDSYSNKIEAITREDIKRAALKFLDPKDYLTVVVGKEKDIGNLP